MTLVEMLVVRLDDELDEELEEEFDKEVPLPDEAGTLLAEEETLDGRLDVFQVHPPSRKLARSPIRNSFLFMILLLSSPVRRQCYIRRPRLGSPHYCHKAKSRCC